MIYLWGSIAISCSSRQGCVMLTCRCGGISPVYFIENNRRIESKEHPSSIPLLLVIAYYTVVTALVLWLCHEAICRVF